MQNRMCLLSLVLTALFATACDGEAEPEYSAEPGIDVCEAVVDECAQHCDVEGFECAFDIDNAFSKCGWEVESREGLQEEAYPHYGSATWAAEGVIVGYFTSCEVLISFPVFCYGCKD